MAALRLLGIPSTPSLTDFFKNHQRGGIVLQYRMCKSNDMVRSDEKYDEIIAAVPCILQLSVLEFEYSRNYKFLNRKFPGIM